MGWMGREKPHSVASIPARGSNQRETRRGVSLLINDSEWFESLSQYGTWSNRISRSLLFHLLHISVANSHWMEWNINWPKRFSITMMGKGETFSHSCVYTYYSSVSVCFYLIRHLTTNVFVCFFSNQVMDLTIRQRRRRSRWWPRRRPARPLTANIYVNQVNITKHTHKQKLPFNFCFLFFLFLWLLLLRFIFSFGLWRWLEILFFFFFFMFRYQYWTAAGPTRLVTPLAQSPQSFYSRCDLFAYLPFLMPRLIL